MKKIFAFVLSVTLAICMTGVAASLSDDELWQTALSSICAQTGCSENQVSMVQMEHSGAQVSISALVGENDSLKKRLLTVQMDENGTILSITDHGEMNIDQVMDMDIKSCFNREDCYLLLPEKCEKWKTIMAALSPEEIERLPDKFAALVNLDYFVPDKNCIPYDTALEAALDEISKHFDDSIDKHDLYRLAISACYTPEDLGNPVYFFYFEKHSYFEDAYSTDKAMNDYTARLEKAYGGQPPYKLSVMVDPYHGEILRPIMMDFPPVQFHYLDFILRTPEIIAEEARLMAE